MARQIIQRVWCDPCMLQADGDDEVLVEATEVTVAFGAMKPRVIAVCEVHSKELIEPLRDMIQGLPTVDGGNPGSGRPKAAVAAENEVECLVPGCGARLKNRGSLSSHVRQSHDMPLVEYRKQYEQGQGQLTLDDEPEKIKVECNVEGCSKTYNINPKRANQVLAIHRSNAHGMKAEK